MPLVLLDYPVLRLSTPVTAAVALSIACPPVPPGYVWRVDQVACGIVGFTSNPSGLDVNFSPAQVLLFDRAVAPGVLPIAGGQLSLGVAPVPGSPNAQAYYAFDDQGSPLTIRGGDALTVVFYPNGIVGGQALIRVQYGFYQGVAGQPAPMAGLESAPSVPAGL